MPGFAILDRTSQSVKRGTQSTVPSPVHLLKSQQRRHDLAMPSGSLTDRENSRSALGAACAFARRYKLAKRWRALRLIVGVLLGTVGVIVAVVKPSTSDYVAAAAAGWLVLSRTVLLSQEEREQHRGALAQEAFDVEVLRLPWNATATGPEPALEDLRSWGSHQDEEPLLGWYTDTEPAPFPIDAVICQRASLTWARQDHVAYARVLRVIVAAALLGTIAVGIALELSLGDYVLRLGLPVLPAVVDILDIAKVNDALGRKRALIADEADRLYTRTRQTGVLPTAADCRRLQDQIYASRTVIGVPGWFYGLTRSGRQRNMEEAVRDLVDRLPPSLHDDQVVPAEPSTGFRSSP